MSQTTSNELAKSFEPADIEARWYPVWESRGYFKAGSDPAKPGFAIQLPPPNITGILHMGHAFNQTVMDSLTRYYRMQGYNTLWLPGTDHAGIATQIVVERQLQEEGTDRRAIGREAFISKIWEWQKYSGGTILNQMRRLGDSLDWKRLYFTMNDKLSAVVRETFVRLYNEGLIYKGLRLVNWDPTLQSAVSDLEVESAEENGHMWEIRYPAADGTEGVVVATTRPETIPGDTAICVHPDDERYRDLVGKTAIVPICGRHIPIIADRYVDREFGTGALKVTPCHDHNDWALGKNHNLEFIQVIDEDGIMKPEAGKYAGLTKQACREAIIKDIEEAGDLVGIEPLVHSVGHCYRCHTVVEPHVSQQWFVATTKMAAKARAAMPAETRLLPESWLKTYYHWLDTIRDWCISRQIWWGHRIPAWTCQKCGNLMVEEEAPHCCSKCGSTELHQEDDVLDTWFSSALWPFSTLGWPEKTEDLDYFYPDDTKELRKWFPTSVLVTGFDILFFWVARMMMMSQHFMGQVPFKDVYLHALVRDSTGRKMSKSTGNVIDPVKMIDQYGCDALRFTLMAFAAMGRDIKLSEERIEGYRHFVNKVWNSARFTLMNLGESAPEPVDLTKVKGLDNQWILHRLEILKQEEDKAFEEYRFNDVAQGCYKFLWSEFCDWYLELVKSDMQDPGRKPESQYVLYTVLKEFLILLHPVMPFVTAEIWQALPGHAGEDIAVMPYPEMRPGCLNPEKAAQMEFLLRTGSSGLMRSKAPMEIFRQWRHRYLSTAHRQCVTGGFTEKKKAFPKLGSR